MRDDLISIVPPAYRHMGPYKAAIHWMRARVSDLKKVRDNAASEIEMWEAMLKRTPMCGECNGTGEISYVDDPMDGRRFRKCSECDGSGEPQFREVSDKIEGN